MSNFNFLYNSWPEIFREAQEAEMLTYTSPKASAVICRSALEKTVNWLYANDVDLEEPYNTSLASLMHEQCFKDILKPSMFREINLIRLVGNNAAHGKNIRRDESLVIIKNLYRFTAFLAIYYSEDEPDILPFDETLIPTGEEQKIRVEELKRLETKLNAQNEQARIDRDELEAKAKEVEELRKKLLAQQEEIRVRKEEREKAHDIEVEVPLLVSEAQTRKLYIDQSLKEAGWNNLREGYELEYEVKGMPLSTNPSGIGYVDYVLWGDDGKPLAVVEAKKSMADPRKGKHQAKLYADCLEKETNQRPIIFYTNGFETILWDDQFYPERDVQGFYTKDELQLLIDRKESRLDLKDFKVNEEISGRYYQIEAIQRVAESFSRHDSIDQLTGGSRKALLVMATGSGKTRTAISIVDMLTKCNWAKRVLFLADRNALVSQAKRNFSEQLPNLSAIDLTKEKEDNGTRLVFSTYPTIMNKIDSAKTDDERFYGVGHFDLIIIDEAHRSVYQKYGAIFDYFDSMLVGLTATPKTDIDHNTYGLFDIEDNNPTFAYELDQAVKDKFLVPPKSYEIPIKFPREGIKYSELSDQERAEYEEKFGDPSEGAPEEIGGEALNRWLFNTDTVDKALAYLMEKGIKVEGGDKIGKTIIFAKNHEHALFIEERFNKNYPEYKGDFLRVIDNYESKAQDLLERFCDEYQEVDPQIAVSVDMMDTGVDAPRVVNLVFFKMVKSFTKFWQMIGRGTRLCPNLYGPGEDKKNFVIFDLCENLSFFEVNPEGIQTRAVKSMTQKIFELKLELGIAIREADNTTEEDQELGEDLLKNLHNQVKHLDQSRFMVKSKLRYVVEYSNQSRWENLSKGDVLDIKNNLSKLVVPEEEDDELARRFDVLMLSINLARFSGKDDYKRVSQVVNICTRLEKKKNIPAVSSQLSLIEEIQKPHFWERTSPKLLEEVRKNLRDLIKFLDRENQEIVYTHFQDEINEDGVQEKELVAMSTELESYKNRVESYIRNNKHHVTIQKLRKNIPITEAELGELERLLFETENLGSKDEYLKEYGNQPLGIFIRSIIGLDIQSAKEAFAEFLQAGNLKADQMTFINNIIQFLERNGTIDPAMLFEPPFTDVNDQGLLGVFDDAEAHKVISILERIKGNAGVA